MSFPHPKFSLSLIFITCLFVFGQERARAEEVIIPVKDITADLEVNRISAHCARGGYNYYLIRNGSVGREYFAAPVGSEDLKLLVDSIPGPSGTFSVNWFSRCDKFYNGYMYLASRTGDDETTIYRSKGTPESTELVGTVDQWLQIIPRAGKYLLYVDETEDTGFEPWSFNLETGEVQLLADLNPGSGASNPQLGSASVELDGKVFFRATNGATGTELFVSDGTPEGTKLLKDIWPGTSAGNPFNFRVSQGKVYFTAETAGEGRELWVSDGTEDGTKLVRDFNPGSARGVSSIRERDGFLYLQVETPEYGKEPWISDGTAAGSSLLQDIIPGATGSDPIFYEAKIAGDLIFAATTDTSSSNHTFFRTDGTPGGTSKLLDEYDSILARFTPVAQADSAILFIGDTEEHGRELWRTDGTNAGTIRLTDLAPGPEDGVSGGSGFEPFGNSVIFYSSIGSSFVQYRVDVSTFEVQNLGFLDPVASQSSWPSNFYSIGSKFLFSATTPSTGREIWISDGTEAGTQLVTDAVEGKEGVFRSNTRDQPFVQIGSYHYFIGQDKTHGAELWRTDGTADGTELVKDINPGEESALNDLVHQFSVVNGKLVFSADDGTHGRELWVSDGTAEGTALLKDIYAGANRSINGARNWLVFNGLLFFRAQSASAGTELWVSDGTSDGTTLLKDINPGTSSSSPNSFRAFQGKVYFSAYSPANGTELWKTDGTSSGTRLSDDIISGSGSSSAIPLLGTDDWLLLRAQTPGTGPEPWVKTSESSPAKLLKDTRPGPSGYFLQVDPASEVLNSVLLFLAETDGEGREVWRTDGTPGGTYLLKDIREGQFSSATFLNPRVYNGKIYFTADDGIHGNELWYSDGSPEGTKMLADHLPGRDGGVSPIDDFLRFNGKVFFSAVYVVEGTELSTLGADQCPSDPSKGYPGYCGCGLADLDTDLDLVIECSGGCPTDPRKTLPGACGCGVIEADANGNGVFDCLASADLRASLSALRKQLTRLKAKGSYKSKKAKRKEREIKGLIRTALAQVGSAQSLTVESLGINAKQSKYNKAFRSVRKAAKKALKNNASSFGQNRKRARGAVSKLLRLLR